MTSNGNGRHKETLNVSSSESDSDEGMNVRELLDKYTEVNDSEADPDYVLSGSENDRDSSTFDFTSDSDEERTESQKKLNGNTRVDLWT